MRKVSYRLGKPHSPGRWSRDPDTISLIPWFKPLQWLWSLQTSLGEWPLQSFPHAFKLSIRRGFDSPASWPKPRLAMPGLEPTWFPKDNLRQPSLTSEASLKPAAGSGHSRRAIASLPPTGPWTSSAPSPSPPLLFLQT